MTADLHTLARLIPAQARLVLDPGANSGEAGLGEGAAVLPVPTASVRAGDLLRVLPGERIPVDGVVVWGRASADESMLTGEAALVKKEPGSQVGIRTSIYVILTNLLAFTSLVFSAMFGIELTPLD